ncbi:MAG: aminoacyl-tRNA hydrolase [Deltaproteobacteria bacterium RIFCSPLOWO2_02_FULL_47_10]|nr:MAG: aminoacyl-tRNA hydrolase [Deltaproteobacteria bacterium RIFCSPLOWO2_02_FULL_47_10]
MRLLVGLGNPGSKYSLTRHNVGFNVIDLVAEKIEAKIAGKKFSSFFGIAKIGGQDVCIIKPQTFMNLSGSAVADFSGYYKVGTEDILVVHDDIDLPFAKTRFVSGSGAGGHNGVISIIERLGTNEFWRLKIGVGRPPDALDPADYVLEKFTGEEKLLMDKVLPASRDAVIKFFIDKVNP